MYNQHSFPAVAMRSITASPRPDRHPAEKARTVLRIARVSCGHQVGLAIIRNISMSGMMIEAPLEMELDGLVEIDMGLRMPCTGEVRWRNNSSVGIQLLEPIDVEQVLGKHGVDTNGLSMRLPRVAVTFPAEVVIDSTRRKVEILDISVGGAKILLSQAAAVGDQLTLRLQGHGPIESVVRWAARGEAGISFNQPLPIFWLMAWLSSQNRSGVASVPERAVDRAIIVQPPTRQHDAATLVTSIDAEGLIVSANANFLSFSSYTENELRGTKFASLMVGESATDFTSAVHRALEADSIWHGEICCRSKAGEEFWLETTAIPSKDGTGSQQGCTMFHFDITKRKSEDFDLWHLANVDPITNLPNRLSFIAALGEILTQTDGPPKGLAVVLLDLDNFMSVNDRRGYLGGDAVLAEIADRISKVLEDKELVARIGGDEFAVLIIETGSAENMARRVQSLLDNLSRPLITGGKEERITASAGISRYPEAGKTAAELIRNADISLGEAKRDGRNRLALFNHGMLAKLQRRSQILDDFAQGLKAEQIEVFYEPIVPIKGEALPTFEALCRWRHPERGVLEASEFSDVFHDDGLTIEVGCLVIRKVIAQIEDWRSAGLCFASIAINATLADLRSRHFVTAILAAIAEGKIAANDICVEITEQVLRDESLPRARAEIQRLHDANVCVTFDDFGTGYSSLRHLRDMPICGIKIDRSFVSLIADSQVDRGLVRGIVDLAHMMNKHVVAEGVEVRAQAEILRDLGCDYIQGHLVSRALPAPAAAEFLRTFLAQEFLG